MSGKKKGPSIDPVLRCRGCESLNVWWNGGPYLYAKCEEKSEYIPGYHQPGHAGDIKTPEWCPFRKKVEVEGNAGVWCEDCAHFTLKPLSSGFSHGGNKDMEKMPAWEYKIFVAGSFTEGDLDLIGKDGWELTSIWHHAADCLPVWYFKRRAKSSSSASLTSSISSTASTFPV